MTTPEFAAQIDQLLSLCERALRGEPTDALAREALRQALSDQRCLLRQPATNAYAETVRLEGQHRAQIVLELDSSSASYRAAVVGLERHLVALRDEAWTTQ
jgi:hypothetical protein